MTQPDVEQDVRLAIERRVRSVNSHDIDTLASLLSDRPGSTHIGSDPDEWCTKQQLLDGMRAVTESEGHAVRVEITETSVHSLGEVAWTESRGRFVNPNGQEREVRATGVYVNVDGEWRATQSHVSIGVSNAHIFTAITI